MLDPDARAGRQVQLGLSREGVRSAIAPVDGPGLEIATEDAGLVIVGGTDGRALDLLRKTRLLLDEHKLEIPIVFTGRGVRRTDAEAAGADEVVLLPAFLRDVVTIGRLLLLRRTEGQRAQLVGSLAETTGVFPLVRALAALGRSAVLTLIRGLRRGEIRFFHGEVTSAQVGLIHGQAAFHQLLLWTEARFEFHHEDVVRRQQIPLSPEELFLDAERFLVGVRDSSGQLSPSMVLEQDVQRVQSLGKQIPTEVHGVLRMFDGHRVLADILEDSPYRVFETLRVAQRACDVGLLRVVDGQKPKATWRAVLAIEEWLVGSDRDAVIQRTQAASDSGPIPAARDSSQKVKGGKRKRKQKKRVPTPASTPAVQTKPDIDWGALVPRVVGAEVGSLSGVVPASQASGEIELPTRGAAREKLEALMDTEKRERIFAKDIGLEAKVVFDEGDDQAKAAEEKAAANAKADADKLAADAKAKAAEEKAAANAKADADKLAADAKAKADADKLAADAKAKADADKLAADAKAKADADKLAADAKAKADADKLAADAKAKAATKARRRRQGQGRRRGHREGEGRRRDPRGRGRPAPRASRGARGCRGRQAPRRGDRVGEAAGRGAGQGRRRSGPGGRGAREAARRRQGAGRGGQPRKGRRRGRSGLVRGDDVARGQGAGARRRRRGCQACRRAGSCRRRRGLDGERLEAGQGAPLAGHRRQRDRDGDRDRARAHHRGHHDQHRPRDLGVARHDLQLGAGGARRRALGRDRASGVVRGDRAGAAPSARRDSSR
ncbi:MAG: DUF4388 domain-containing protein [Myxococcales bacterium]|nr:DUF4388 domain-containing protein [Myxococcales bacterium]